jgi:hypothetical protein
MLIPTNYKYKTISANSGLSNGQLIVYSHKDPRHMQRFTANAKIPDEQALKRPRPTVIDTRQIASDFAKFMSANHLPRNYISKHLNISRAYLVETLRYPIKYDQIRTSKGKVIYMELKKINDNKSLKHELVVNYRKMSKRATPSTDGQFSRKKIGENGISKHEEVKKPPVIVAKASSYLLPTNRIFNEEQMQLANDVLTVDDAESDDDDDDCQIIESTSSSDTDCDSPYGCKIINIPFVF